MLTLHKLRLHQFSVIKPFLEYHVTVKVEVEYLYSVILLVVELLAGYHS